MLPVLLRQRFQLYRNELIRGPGASRRLALLAGSWALGVFFLGIVARNTEALVLGLVRQDAALAGSALPLTFAGFAVVAVLTALASPLHHLYLGSDLELLLAAPVPPRDVFLLKMAEVWRDTALTFWLGLAITSGYGLALAMPLSFFLLAALLVGALTLIAAAAGVLAILVLVRVAPPGRVLAVVRLLAVLVVLPAVLLVPFMTGGRRFAGGLGGQRAQVTAFASFVRGADPPPGWLPTTWVANALAVDYGRPWMTVDLTLVAATALAVVGLAFVAFRYTFSEGWDRARQVTTTSRFKARRGSPSTRLGPLPPSVSAIVYKDWRTLPRDPRWLAGLLASLAIVAASVLSVTFGGPRAGIAAATGFQFWLALLSVAYLTLALGSQHGSGAFGYEGRNIVLLRAAPVPTSAILVGKMLAGFLPNLAVAWLVTLAVGVWLHGSPAEVGLALAMAAWLMAGSVASSVGVAALTSNFASDNPQRSLGWLGLVVTLGLDGPFFVASVGLFAAGLLQSRAAVPARLAGMFPLVDTLLLVLVAGSVAAIVVVALLGGRRLAAWEGQ